MALAPVVILMEVDRVGVAWAGYPQSATAVPAFAVGNGTTVRVKSEEVPEQVFPPFV